MTNKVITWLIVALVILLALWLIVNVEAHAATCMDMDARERIRVLQLEAVDEAFKDRTKHLFEVWMQDPNGQPKRAQSGVASAIDAYLFARSSALKWDPPVCP